MFRLFYAQKTFGFQLQFCFLVISQISVQETTGIITLLKKLQIHGGRVWPFGVCGTIDLMDSHLQMPSPDT